MVKDNGISQKDFDEKLSLISRKIQKMMKMRVQIRKSLPNRQEISKIYVDKSQITCFGSNKLGHYKTECPHNKKKIKKESHTRKKIYDGNLKRF